jgi:phosphoribosylformylglycinamidine synthase
MTLGNNVGFEFSSGIDIGSLNCAAGAIIAETAQPTMKTDAMILGKTIAQPEIRYGGETLSIHELKELWEDVLEGVYPTKTDDKGSVPLISYDARPAIAASGRFAKPRVLIFAFPGSNCEIDTARAVIRAGGDAHIHVVRNLTQSMLSQSIAEAAKLISNSRILIIPGGFSFGDEPDGSAKFITVFFRNSIITDAVHEHLHSNDGLMLGICNGFQALIKLGLVPYGKIIAPRADSPTLVSNLIGRHQARYVNTRIASVSSPWMSRCNVGDIHTVAVSHGEGRFVADESLIKQLASDGRIATQYVDYDGEPAMDTSINPNGSAMAVEGIFSPDGRVFGKMGHTERHGEFVAKNICGNKHQPIFESGIEYFR